MIEFLDSEPKKVKISKIKYLLQMEIKFFVVKSCASINYRWFLKLKIEFVSHITYANNLRSFIVQKIFYNIQALLRDFKET